MASCDLLCQERLNEHRHRPGRKESNRRPSSCKQCQSSSDHWERYSWIRYPIGHRHPDIRNVSSRSMHNRRPSHWINSIQREGVDRDIQTSRFVTYDQQFMNDFHFRFEKHHQNEWQVRDEIDQDGTESGQIRFAEESTDQVSRRQRSDALLLFFFLHWTNPSIKADMAKASKVKMVTLSSDAGKIPPYLSTTTRGASIDLRHAVLVTYVRLPEIRWSLEWMKWLTMKWNWLSSWDPWFSSSISHKDWFMHNYSGYFLFTCSTFLSRSRMRFFIETPNVAKSQNTTSEILHLVRTPTCPHQCTQNWQDEIVHIRWFFAPAKFT